MNSNFLMARLVHSVFNHGLLRRFLISVVCVFLVFTGRGTEKKTIAVQVADLYPGGVGSLPAGMKVFGNSLLFSASSPGTGEELWRYNGSVVSLVSNINDNFTDHGSGSIVDHDSSPDGLTEYNGALFFSAYDERRGAELWRTDGTNCLRVADINPDNNDNIKTKVESSWPKQLIVVSNSLYFPATAGARDNYELWKFDGVSAVLTTNIHPDSGSDYSSYPNGLIAWNGALYFQAQDNSHGYELWKHDGNRTVLLADLNTSPSSGSSYPKYFTPFNNHLYFQAYTPAIGTELWRTDGTNIILAKDILAGAGSSFPEFLTVFNGALYFRASGSTVGSELWKFDGTNATAIADINPFGDSYPKNLTVYKDTLCFAADDGINGWELWKFDGAVATLVTNLNGSGDSFPEYLTVFDGDLYFVATTPDTGYELWRYNGTNVTLVHDINPGPGNGYPLNLTPFGQRLCFSAADNGVSNWELWTVTNTTNGYLGVFPFSSFNTSGDIGGPFEPGPVEYTLTNLGMAALNWIATNTQDWLTLSVTNGTLSPGEMTTVTVSISSNATTLPAGVYLDTVSFVDTTANCVGALREARLTVLPTFEIISSAMIDGNIVFEFPTVAEQSYTVEYADSLPPLFWTELSTVTGNGGIMAITNTTPSANERFYRVRKP